MEKKITAEELTKDIINIAKLLKERSEKRKDELDSPIFIVDLSTIEPEIHSLYMQKMADMTKEELEEVLSKIAFDLTEAKSKAILSNININDEDVVSEIKFLKRFIEEFKTDAKESSAQIPEDLEFNYIEATIKKLVKVIHQIRPEYYPIYYGELVHTDTVNLVNYYYSNSNTDEDKNIEFPHYLFLPIFSYRKFAKNIEEIKHHYGYVMLKPLNYEVIYIALFVEILLDYIELNFQGKFIQKLIKPTSNYDDELEINFNKLEKLVNSLIELYINFITGKKSPLITNEFSRFLTKARKFLEQNYEKLFQIVEEEAENYYEKLVEFNETLIPKIDYTYLKSNIVIQSIINNENFKVDEEILSITKKVQIYGLKGLDFKDLILEYDSDDIYDFLLGNIVLAFENNLYIEAEYLLETVKFLIEKLPYISKNYNYESIDNIVRLIALENPENKPSLENIKPEFRYLWLMYLYKIEKYEEFINFTYEFEKIDKELMEEIKDDLLIYKEFARFYTSKITKEKLIKFLEELAKMRKKELGKQKQISKALIYALNEENKKLEKHLEDFYLEEIFEFMNIYPYHHIPYELLEIEFDYKLKQKRF